MQATIPDTVDEVVEQWWTQDPKSIPHETGGTLRMKRGGMHPAKIKETLEMEPMELVRSLQNDIDREHEAYHLGRPIHTPTMRGVK